MTAPTDGLHPVQLPLPDLWAEIEPLQAALDAALQERREAAKKARAAESAAEAVGRKGSRRFPGGPRGWAEAVDEAWQRFRRAESELHSTVMEVRRLQAELARRATEAEAAAKFDVSRRWTAESAGELFVLYRERLRLVEESFTTGKIRPDVYERVRAETRRKMREASRFSPSPAARPMLYPPLSRHYHDLLVRGGTDGEDVTHLVALGAVYADWNERILRGALLHERCEGGRHFRELVEQEGPERARQELARVWDSASRATLGPRRADTARQGRMRARIDEMGDAADAMLWRGEGGYTELYTLHALLDIAYRAGTLSPSASERQLSLLIGVEKEAAARATRNLVELGWFSVLEPEHPSLAPSYVPRLPPGAKGWSLRLPSMYLLPPDSSPMVGHDAFHRNALGKARFHLWRMMESCDTPWSVRDLGHVMDCSRRTIERHLVPLVEHALVENLGEGRYRALEPDSKLLIQTAQAFHTAGRGTERGARYAAERVQFGEHLKENGARARRAVYRGRASLANVQGNQAQT